MWWNRRRKQGPDLSDDHRWRIPLSNLSDTEHGFLQLVAKKYGPRQDWTRFADWWNAQFRASGLSTTSVVYRICQDLEARLGIKQGKVSPPDYRDFLVELIDTQFGSRQEFCKVTEVDPGQPSRVLANRGDLSMKVLQKVVEVLNVHLVIQTEEDSRAQTSIDVAAQAITDAVAERTQLESRKGEPASGAPKRDPEQPTARTTLQQLIDEQIGPLREQVEWLERQLQAVGAGN